MLQIKMTTQSGFFQLEFWFSWQEISKIYFIFCQDLGNYLIILDKASKILQNFSRSW